MDTGKSKGQGAVFKMKRKVNDPVRKFGGKPLPEYVLVVLIPLILILGALFWYGASSEGGFSEVEKLAKVKCLGCLGLDPVVPGFSEYWTVYPDDHIKSGEEVPHPEMVKEELEDVDLLILFFWTQGCVPCAEQWEEMVDEEIASGPEDGGREGDRYDGLRIISNDAAERTELYRTYRPRGDETGVPMTTFIFRDSEDEILWWSHYGKMDLGPLEERIEEILDFVEKYRLKDDYDDISSAEDGE